MADLHLTFFGSSAGFPTKNRRNSSIGLWRGSGLYLVDAGEPVAAQFALRDISPDTLRAVFITHMHADHVGGLPMLLQWSQLNRRAEPLTIAMPAEATTGFRDFLELIYLYPDLLGFEREMKPVAPGKVYDRDGVTVEAFSNRHLAGFAERLRREGKGRTGQSFSYLFTVDGTRIVFSGDMAQAGEITELATRADVVVSELAHFQPEELGEALAKTDLKRLVVTHLIHLLEPTEDEIPDRIRKGGFGGEIIMAHDGEEVVL